jgi:aminomethyltransferase
VRLAGRLPNAHSGADGKARAAPAREGSAIFSLEGEEVGVVTSGVQSPCLSIPIGMGYVASRFQKAGSELLVDVRGKKQPLTVRCAGSHVSVGE